MLNVRVPSLGLTPLARVRRVDAGAGGCVGAWTCCADDIGHTNRKGKTTGQVLYEYAVLVRYSCKKDPSALLMIAPTATGDIFCAAL